MHYPLCYEAMEPPPPLWTTKACTTNHTADLQVEAAGVEPACSVRPLRQFSSLALVRRGTTRHWIIQVPSPVRGVLPGRF